ncbi:metallophosphoesterase [bacterium]|nr:metallophosphoesterase [bacterium]
MPQGSAMTLAWSTDPHLDHAGPAGVAGFCDRLEAAGVEAVLLGGDTATAARLEIFLGELADRIGKPIYFVLGNHDFYGGSIAGIRQRVGALDHPLLRWLPQTGPVALGEGVTLVGCGGWGDARLGDFPGSGVVLNDYLLIEELDEVFDRRGFRRSYGAGTALQERLQRLGDAEASALEPGLTAAAAGGRQVVVLTHVPPFAEACWHQGRISDPDWLPHFTCKAVGVLLARTAAAYPECRFTVLCGHTHGEGTARLAPNLVVHTQGAEYGFPEFRLLTIDSRGVGLGA